MEDVGLGKIIESVQPADGDGGGELAVAKAVEEQKGGNVAAHGFGLKAGERAEKSVDVFRVGDTVGVERESIDSFLDNRVGVDITAGTDPLVEATHDPCIF